MAFRAGATVTDLEFVQFHPTTFFRDGAPRFLMTEAIRGEGAFLRNDAGERFVLRYDPAAELAPRDIVARAIHLEMRRSGAPCVWLDATGIPRDRLFARFPTITRFLAAYGLDPSRDRIPVAPAAHYTVGGVATDLEGHSSVPGLFAVGEAAATGVHGANRLASNSLLEGLVFGERVARELLHPSAGAPPTFRRRATVGLAPGRGRPLEAAAWDDLRATLWREVGIVRTGTGLGAAVRRLGSILSEVEAPEMDELPSPGANVALTALLIATAARTRTESRGSHFRTDHPRPVTAWQTHLGLDAVRPAKP
jgi:L-aspartate oxidase